jgi:hypothetical protein
MRHFKNLTDEQLVFLYDSFATMCGDGYFIHEEDQQSIVSSLWDSFQEEAEARGYGDMNKLARKVDFWNCEDETKLRWTFK